MVTNGNNKQNFDNKSLIQPVLICFSTYSVCFLRKNIQIK